MLIYRIQKSYLKIFVELTYDRYLCVKFVSPVSNSYIYHCILPSSPVQL